MRSPILSLSSQPSRRYCSTRNSIPISQLAINGANVGTTLGQYAATDSHATNDYGTFTFPTAGNDSFKFMVTARNPSSSGHTMSFE
jgi:hypothetical protein